MRAPTRGAPVPARLSVVPRHQGVTGQGTAEALAARIGGMDPRDAFRVEGWVAGFRDAEDHRGASTVRRATRAERAGATLH